MRDIEFIGGGRMQEKGYKSKKVGRHGGSKKGYCKGCFGNKKPEAPEPYRLKKSIKEANL